MTTKALSQNRWLRVVAILGAVWAASMLLPVHAKPWTHVIFGFGASFYLAGIVVSSLRTGHFHMAPDRGKDALGYWIAVALFTLLAVAMAVASVFELLELMKSVR